MVAPKLVIGMGDVMEQTPRAIARAWRLYPADRGRIERLIAIEGLQHLFRWHGGKLIARLGPADRERITASGGGAYRPAADRRFGAYRSESTSVAGADIDCLSTLDGEPITRGEADMHRKIARRAA
jgi:hypothetical protein